MAEYEQADRPDLHTAKGLLRRRYLVMLPFLLIPIAALVFSLQQQKQYSASASLVFRDADNVASDDPAREAATNIQLLSDDQIKRGVRERLARSGPIAQGLKAEQEGQANVIRITATDPSPRRAADTANAYANEYVAYRRTLARTKIRQEQEFTRAELQRARDIPGNARRVRSLRAKLRRLEFDAVQSSGGVQVVSIAEPPSAPSSPKPVRNTVIGGIVALFLAVLTAVLFERLDPRVMTPRDVATAIGRPIVGLIPKRRRRGPSLTRRRAPPADADDFLALRARLRYASSDRDIRSVLVTSSAEGDGKTTIAWNLARVAVGPDSRVLFVEADLRHPTVARALGVDTDRSLARVLGGSAALRDVIQEVALPSGQNGGRPSPVISVALAGGKATRSADTLAWERLGSALHQAERDFDLIVIDTPPMLNVPDAIPLVSQVGGVVVVGRLGKTPRAGLARLREQLDAVGAPTLGVVVNSVGKDALHGYGYHGA
jgi:polysaccharide biosynthesis transport protein